jgi:amino acid adenylation domain-containing protein/thioester reductase-like protein
VDVVDATPSSAVWHEPAGPLAGTSSAGADLAYVMFTSGSTGRPKAVGVKHVGVVLLATRNGFLSLSTGSRVMHASTLAFDASTLEIWPALLNGACLVVVDSDMLLAPVALDEHLRRHAVDTVFLTTSLLHHVARTHPRLFDGLAQVLTGGEALDAGIAAVVAGRADRFVNCYGPTECTVVATAQVVAPGAEGPVPIGRPLPFAECVVLGPDDEPVRPGEDGELLVGGGGLAAGYLTDPAETARRFVDIRLGESAGTARYYRTGDRVRQRPDGALEFRGRLDDQVKIRGFRVEPGEVEHALRGAPGVADAAVVSVGEDAAKRLVAFVVPADDMRSDLSGLRGRLAASLPRYMVPAEIDELAELPLTANGKVDRAALRRRATGRRVAAQDLPAEPGPDASTDDVVRSAWATTLGLTTADPGDDFFASGGTSLGAAQLIARVQAGLELDGASGYALIRALLSTPRLDEFTGAVLGLVDGRTGTAQAGDRWRPDIRLPEVVPLTDAPGGDRILLTGATGFFGSYLLRELLARTDAVIECVVRAPDAEAARRRLDAAQEKYGHEPLDHVDRIVALPGDLSAPGLGLTAGALDELALRTSRIYHSAAHVNFVYPYEWLRPANVDGTRALAALALRGGGIPLHYVSTIAMLSGAGSADIRSVSETDAIEHVERMSMGYPESKWVAEKILALASDRGVPVSVYRPYEITGRTSDGSWNTEAAIVAFFKAIVEMGTAPDAALPLDFVPADYLARALVHIAERPGTGSTYHLTNPGYGLLRDMVDRLRAAGHEITTVAYGTWVEQLRDFCTAAPEHPIVSFLPIFTTVAAERDVSVKELYFEELFPAFGRERVEQGLAGSGIVCPPVDAEMLDAYVAWFHRTGWIAPVSVAYAAGTR